MRLLCVFCVFVLSVHFLFFSVVVASTTAPGTAAGTAAGIAAEVAVVVVVSCLLHFLMCQSFCQYVSSLKHGMNTGYFRKL